MPLPNNAKLTDVIAKLQALTGINQIPDLIVTLQAKGITLTGNETMIDLVNLVNSNLFMTGGATASAGDIRFGKTAYKGGTKVSGTLITQATGAQSITPGTTDIVKPAGIYDGTITILGDADLVAGNIPKDVNLFGVQGILERLTTADRNAIISAITEQGMSASPSDTNAQLATKISALRTKMIASDELKLVTYPDRLTTSSRSPLQVMSAKVYFGGTYRVKFSLATYDSSVTGYAQIYVNGTARGIVRSAGTSSGSFTEDITVNPDDSIQIRLWTTQPSGQHTYGYVYNIEIRTQSLVVTQFNSD